MAKKPQFGLRGHTRAGDTGKRDKKKKKKRSHVIGIKNELVNKIMEIRGRERIKRNKDEHEKLNSKMIHTKMGRYVKEVTSEVTDFSVCTHR